MHYYVTAILRSLSLLALRLALNHLGRLHVGLLESLLASGVGKLFHGVVEVTEVSREQDGTY